MKKPILTVAIIVCCSTLGYSQGTIAFNDYFPAGKVYQYPDTLASGVFTVELAYGPSGTPAHELTPIPSSIFTTTASAAGGLFYDTTAITLLGIIAGNGSSDTAQNVVLVVLGWEGNYPDLYAAEDEGYVGETYAFSNPTGGAGSPASVAANLVNWTADNALILSPPANGPEPTTIALGGLGAAILLALRRRKL